MTFDAWTTLLTVGAALALLASNRFTPALVILGADVVLLVLGVIDVEAALSGFSNPAPFTVAALYVVARAVEQGGLLQPMVRAVLGGRTGWRLGRLLVPVAGASGMVNNTPLVAMLAPEVTSWADRQDEPPSRYLLPLSFATILGGLLTVFGTSTNIVVSSLLERAGEPAIGMFEITRLGLPIALLGLVYLIVAAPRLLPERMAMRRRFTENVRDFTVNMVVVPGGSLDGRDVEEAGLRSLHGVFLAEVRRSDEVIAPTAPDTMLEGGDHLLFVGRADDVLDLQHNPGLRSAEHDHVREFQDPGHTYFEAVLGAASPLVGKTLKEVDFRKNYQAAGRAIHRAGEPVRAKLGAVRLHVGDTLLLLSDVGFRERWRNHSDFLLVAHFGGAPPARRSQTVTAGVILLAVVTLAATGAMTMLGAALMGALATMALKVLTPVEARRAVDMNVILLIAASFGLATAIESSGLAATVADAVMDATTGLGPRGALLGVVLVTVVLTELITNNAAAILVFPIALTAAVEQGADPRSFAVAVAATASASFLTPIGYQTNTMVYGLGGYRFSDYVRLGWPLTLLVIVAVVLLVPVLWPPIP